MVTIEQKLTLFSKLLNQEIKEEVDKKLLQLEKEYEKKIVQNKYEVDREANELVEQARRRAETKKVELMSKDRLLRKKEMLQVKEQVVSKFMKALGKKIDQFVKSEAYKEYLHQSILELGDLRGNKHLLEVYITPTDYEKNQEFIYDELSQLGFAKEQISLLQSEEDILGGIVIKDAALNMRVDQSISMLLNDKKDEIIEKLIIAMGEVGEKTHE